ncbi:MAG TPA: hypothetical protein VG938_01060 [Verrucomicrobiae bacterium]|jgi:hypothetical protein|nr:hypothetical protein [Verrucomicrobiae bacterium]
MITTSRKFYFKIAAIALAVSFGLSAYAQSPRENLVHAYHLLKMANHDYAGHRAKAMDEVSTAGRSLGLELGGDLPPAERQWQSDQQLKEARHLIRESRDQLERADRDRAARHLDEAIREIDEALKVK